MTRPSSSELEEASETLKAFGHPTRLAILFHLMDAEQSVGGLEDLVGQSQPHLSRHLAELRRTGVVATTRHGKSVIYRIADRRMERVTQALRYLFLSRDATPPTAASSQGPLLGAAVFATVPSPADDIAAPSAEID